MGVIVTYWEETPERVEYYLKNHKWESRVELHLRYFDLGKAWTTLDNLLCPLEKNHTFPDNFIINATRIPDYESEEDDDESGGVYFGEPPRCFWYSVDKTKSISEFLDSFDRETVHQRCTREFWVAEGYSGDFTSEEEEDFFHSFYFFFEKFQRFFRRTANDKHCVVGRRS